MRKLLLLLLLTSICANAQTIYLNTSLKEIYRANSDNSITLITTTDVVLNDIAIDPGGNFYGITNEGQIRSINMTNGATTFLAVLPGTSPQATALVCNDQNELFTIDTSNNKLYKYNIAANNWTFVNNALNTPGDLTFYKGNLIFPVFSVFDDYASIAAYDLQTETVKKIFCSGIQYSVYYFFHGLTNQYVSCEENNIIGWNFTMDNYDLNNHTITPNPLNEQTNSTMMTVNGLATDNEYMASSPNCYVNLDAVDCVLAVEQNQHPNTALIAPNPAHDVFSVYNRKIVKAIEILDINGRFIKSCQPNGQTFNISDLENGIYFIKIAETSGSTIKKLVKN